MDEVIWFLIGLQIAAVIFIFGWLVGFNASYNQSNWGTGFDDGWKAYKELVKDTRSIGMDTEIELETAGEDGEKCD